MIESSKSKSPGRVRATQPNKSAKSGANSSWPSTELTRVDTRELANDHPHDTDNILIHRLLHPKNAEPRSNRGAERARAPAMAFTNSTASWLHLAPVSRATTTNRQRSRNEFLVFPLFVTACSMQDCSVGLCCSKPGLSTGFEG